MKKIAMLVVGMILIGGITGCEILNQLTKSTSGKTESKSYEMPFSVKIGGQYAKSKNRICAAIANPISNSAKVEVEVDAPKDKMIIMNIFPSDKEGKLDNQAKAAMVLIKKGENTTTLDQTMDKKALAAGTYMMNLVANGKTARILFTVK